MTQEELELIEVSNAEAREDVEMGEAFKRLLEDPDYQKVIAKGYMINYARELGEAISTNTGAYDDDELVADLKGINGLVKYGFKIASNYRAAEQTIRDNEAFVAASVNEEE